MVHIDAFSFGKIIVNGVPCNNDINIIGSDVMSAWWRKSGHQVDVEDIQIMTPIPCRIP